MLKKSKLTKDKKILIENFLSLGFLQVASYIFPLFTVPYLAHVIGADYLGEIAFASAVMVYFQTIVDYGFVYSGVRDVARNRDSLAKVSDIYSLVMCSRFFLLIVSFIILIILIIIVPKFTSLWQILLMSFFIVVGHSMFPDWIFQGMERMKYITIFNVSVKFFFTICIFIFIKDADNYLLQPLFLSMGYLLCGLVAMTVIRQWGIKLHFVPLKDIFIGLRKNVDLFLNSLVPNLYGSTSVLFLGFWHGNTANGIFDAANRFNSASSSLFSIVSRTFYPFLSRRMDKHGIFERINLALSGVIGATLFFGSPLIIHILFPEDFYGAIPTLRIIGVSIIFLAMTDIYGTNSLILMGYERKMRQITLISSIIGLVAAIPLVYFFSYIGIAWTILISRMLMGLSSMYYSKKLNVKQ